MKKSDLRSMSIDELQKELHEVQREYFNLRMQQGTRQLEKPNLIRIARRQVARIKTLITEKANKGTNDE